MMANHRRLLGATLALGLGACENTTGSDVLVSPGGLSVSALSPSSLQVSWNPGAGAAGYEIARAQGTAAFVVLDSVSAAPFVDSGLEAQTVMFGMPTMLRNCLVRAV